ncbi:hypothetical protein Q1695_012579 [Nippostrongylus brasiliensis]|nr:hypothetical protein Q1695_012579 [Nippostrongylus brasiliensis]
MAAPPWFVKSQSQVYIAMFYFVFSVYFREETNDKTCGATLAYYFYLKPIDKKRATHQTFSGTPAYNSSALQSCLGNRTTEVLKSEESRQYLQKRNHMGLLKPFVRFREAFLIAPKYSLATCQIEKTMSTFRAGLFCYLNKKEDFIAAGRQISTENWFNTLCDDRIYEKTYSDVEGSLGENSLIFAVVRNPIARFMSGFFDKCIQEDPPLWIERCACFCCKHDITCFLKRLKSHLLEFQSFRKIESQTDFYYMRHFAPLTWYCNFGKTLASSYIVFYSNRKRFQVAQEIDKVLSAQEIPAEDRSYVRKQLLQRLPSHSTATNHTRKTIEQKFFHNRENLELFLDIYFFDYIAFKFELPKLGVDRSSHPFGCLRHNSYAIGILFYILTAHLSEVCAATHRIGKRTNDKFRCTFSDGEDWVGTFTDAVDLELGFDNKCTGATSITLLSGKTLHLESYSEDNINSLLSFSSGPLHMCLNISDTDIETVSLSATAIDGKCKGPQVTIMNNKRLTDVEFGKKLLQGFAKAKGKRISIHGNPKLKARTIKKLSKYKFVDVQQHTSECTMPNPLSTLDPITKGRCTAFYGPVVIPPKTASLNLPSPQFETKYSLTGCIKIEHTALKNVKFLRMFRDVTPLAGCENSIKNNPQLCLIEELDFLQERFRNLTIMHNRKDCENDCLGGEVTEAYLADIGRCTIIHGDVLIRNWKEKPVYVDLLHKIKKISGKLIIEDNENLGEFDYFSGLEVVRGKGDGPVIIVRNNPDLTLLTMPRLKEIKLQQETIPTTTTTTIATTTARTTAEATATTAITTTEVYEKSVITTAIKKRSTRRKSKRTRRTKRVSSKSTAVTQQISAGGVHKHDKGNQPAAAMETSESHSIVKWIGVAVTVAILLIVIIAVVIVVVVLLTRRKAKSTISLEPATLDGESKKVLDGLVEHDGPTTATNSEISSADPVSWNSNYSGALVTPAEKIDFSRRSFAGKDDDSDMASNLAASMIPLATNGKPPIRNSNKFLHQRMQEMFPYDLVIMIGNCGDITETIPGLPIEKGAAKKYRNEEGVISYAYKFVYGRTISSRTTHFVYKVKQRERRKKKFQHIVHFDWQRKRYPTEFDELLQIIKLSSEKSAICVSNRRKEVFSLIYLLFKCVSQAEQVKLIDVFRFHSQNCNGAPLDSEEMVFALYVLARWSQSLSLADDASNKKRNDWCEKYNEMSKFANANRSVRNILQEHLDAFNNLEFIAAAHTKSKVAILEQLTAQEKRNLGEKVETGETDEQTGTTVAEGQLRTDKTLLRTGVKRRKQGGVEQTPSSADELRKMHGIDNLGIKISKTRTPKKAMSVNSSLDWKNEAVRGRLGVRKTHFQKDLAQ